MPMVWGTVKKAGFAFVALSVVSGMQAKAADMLGGPVFETEQTTQVEFGTGWYIRGDLSLGQNYGNDTTRVPAWNNESTFEIPHSFGIGAGRYFSENFRADITVERFAIMKTFADNGACDPLINGGDCRHSSRGEASANAVLLNAYWDIVNLGGFKPYVGAGIGLAEVDWTSFSAVGTATDGSVVDAPITNTEATYQPIIQLQVGASYRFAKNWNIDASYRISGVPGDEFQDVSVPVGNRKTFASGDFYNQELRIGLRYDIW